MAYVKHGKQISSGSMKARKLELGAEKALRQMVAIKIFILFTSKIVQKPDRAECLNFRCSSVGHTAIYC